MNRKQKSRLPKIGAVIFSLILLVQLGFDELKTGGYLDGVPEVFSSFSEHVEAILNSEASDDNHTNRSVKSTSSQPRQALPVPNPLANFHEAKQVARKLFQDHRETFYCSCKFDQHNRIDLASCGYRIQQDKRRAQRLEWEHIVPVSHLAAHLECWRKPICCKETKNGKSCFRGRKCCQQIDPDFAKMEADLHNLVPEIGELNALRSNYRFGELPHIAEHQFGQCELKIDPETRRVEPSSTVKGIIARVYLYMSDTYHFHLSDSQRQLFTAWNTQYPPDAWEIEWDNRIFKIQGNHNLYISNYAVSIGTK